MGRRGGVRVQDSMSTAARVLEMGFLRPVCSSNQSRGLYIYYVFRPTNVTGVEQQGQLQQTSGKGKNKLGPTFLFLPLK